jgi:hypothetical protein
MHRAQISDRRQSAPSLSLSLAIAQHGVAWRQSEPGQALAGGNHGSSSPITASSASAVLVPCGRAVRRRRRLLGHLGRIRRSPTSTGTYQAGASPSSANQRPAGHEAAGRAIAQSIQPIGGRSCSSRSAYRSDQSSPHRAAGDEPSGSPPGPPRHRLRARGQDARRAAVLVTGLRRQRLAQPGVDSTQVRAAWVKEAVARPITFPEDARELQALRRCDEQPTSSQSRITPIEPISMRATRQVCRSQSQAYAYRAGS